MKFRFSIYITLFICIFSTTYSLAENKILLCNKYDKSGNYSDAFESWKIQKISNFMYVFYQSDIPITDTIFFTLQKTVGRRDTNYYNYDNYYLVTDSSKKWAVNKFIFTDAGNYKITAFNRNSTTPLATHYTTITFQDEDYKNTLFYDTWYYNKSVIAFCDSVSDNKKLFGEREIFTYHPSGTAISLYISHHDELPLKTDLLYIKIYAINQNNKLISSGTFHIIKLWHWTYVPIKLTEKGNYLVEVYDENEIFINSNTLEIR